VVNDVVGPRLLDAALAAARSGLHVFPVRPYGKTPAVRDWEHAATTDPSVMPSTPTWRPAAGDRLRAQPLPAGRGPSYPR
jgi:hypothetical protein